MRLTSSTSGEFTWDFGQTFYVRTDEGNFIFSDPVYNGDNTLRETNQTYDEWIDTGAWGRDKGMRNLGAWCSGATVILLDGSTYQL